MRLMRGLIIAALLLSPVAVRGEGDAEITGRSVVVGQVEGKAGDYIPDPKAPEFAGLNILDRGGPSVPNGHATAVGRTLYGRSGLAAGVRTVYAYPVESFLGDLCLKTGQPAAPRAEDDVRLFTHSWIGQDMPGSTEILRRVDHLIDRDDVIMVVGVNNGKNTPIPALLGSAHNVIAVGVSSGNSSGGYTKVEGSGRCKPDLVAARNLTSFSTPVVAAAAARLLEAADRMAARYPQARRAEVIKAALLTGTEKPAGWAPHPGRPLDEHLGAGSLHAGKALAILQAGRQPAGVVNAPLGWDFSFLSPMETGKPVVVSDEAQPRRDYHFTTTEPMGEVCLTLVWHRRIDGRVINDPITRTRLWVDHPTRADLDLELVAVGDGGAEVEVAASRSRIDNVEHVFVRDLPPGHYVAKVTRMDAGKQAWDYALAWRMEPPAPVTP